MNDSGPEVGICETKLIKPYFGSVPLKKISRGVLKLHVVKSLITVEAYGVEDEHEVVLIDVRFRTTITTVACSPQQWSGERWSLPPGGGNLITR